MNIETVAIDSIQPDPSNVRRHSTRNLDAIKGSLTRFGQQRPILVNNAGIVLAGNGTLQAARELGWTSIQIIRTTLMGSEATAYAIADNRTSETSEWDRDGLASLLTSLQAEDEALLASSGFTPDELATLLGGTPTSEAPVPPDDFPEVTEDVHTDHRCPKCGYVWSGKAAG